MRCKLAKEVGKRVKAYIEVRHPPNNMAQLLRNVTVLRNKDCNTPSPSTRST